MSQLNVDDIYNNGGDGAPTLPAGVTVSGITTQTGILLAASDVRVSGNINAGISTFSGKATVGSVTLQHSNIVSGVVTATSYYGDAANMTNAGISAGKAMGLASFLVY
tara:strand:+ start:28 stop:351 length:324 start_codon:yes stop_codon:yes gene_type:complete